MSDPSEYRPQGTGPHSTLAGNVLDPNVSADGHMSGGQGVGGTSESNIKQEGLEHIKQNTSGYNEGATGQQQQSGGMFGSVKNMLGMGGASSTTQEPGLSSGSTYDNNAGTATDPSATGAAGGYTGVSQGLGGVNPTSSTREEDPSLGRDALAAGGLTGAGAGASGLNDRTAGGYQEDPSVSREGFGNSSTGGLSGPRDGYSGTNPDISRDSTLGGTTGTDSSLGRDSTLGGSSGMTDTDSSRTGEYAAGGAGLGAGAGAVGSEMEGSRTTATGNEPGARDTELSQKDAHATGDPEDMQETQPTGDKEGAAQSEKKDEKKSDAHASTRENPSAIPTAGGERLGEKHWGESKIVPDNPKPRESSAGISSGDGQPTSEVRDNTNANTGSASDPHGSKSGEKEGLVDKIKDKLHMGH